MNGKGSGRRPTNESRYRANYEAWEANRKKQQQQDKAAEITSVVKSALKK